MRHQRCGQDPQGPPRLPRTRCRAELAVIGCGSDVSPGSGSLGTSPSPASRTEAFCQDLGDVATRVHAYRPGLRRGPRPPSGRSRAAAAPSLPRSRGWSRRRRSAAAIEAANAPQRWAQDPRRRRRCWRRRPPTSTCAPSGTRSGPSMTRSATSTAKRRSPRSPKVSTPSFGLEQASLPVRRRRLPRRRRLLGAPVNAYVPASRPRGARLLHGHRRRCLRSRHGRRGRRLHSPPGYPKPASSILRPRLRSVRAAVGEGSLKIAALQGALAGAGFYDGPIDAGRPTRVGAHGVPGRRGPPAHRSDRRRNLRGAPAQEPGRRSSPTTTAAPSGTTPTSEQPPAAP